MSLGYNLSKITGTADLANLASLHSTPTEVPSVNQIEMPDWLTSNPDDNLQELLSSFAGVQKAFDPTKQVKARNAAIAYNTSAGGEAASNAATEYANRAAQSGASALGAGVVKAQAMMPVLAQNAALKSEAADVAAKSHQEGLSLAAQIASTIDQLRTTYLRSLTDFAQNQQQIRTQNQQYNQGLDLEKIKLAISEKNTNAEQARLAAMGLLGAAGPSGNYTTDHGRVTAGQDEYNRLLKWKSSRDAAQQALMGML